jgi:RNA polymerase sigma factor (sigma-70 family)
MVNSNLRLVVSVAREYAGRGVPLLDLIQEGSIGLLAAARKFDYTLDNRFSTYATKWIYRGVIRCLLDHERLIRIPTGTAELIWKVEQTRAALQQSSGTMPTDAQIAACCGIPESKVAELVSFQPELCSLDAPVGEEGTLGLLLEDLQTPQPQEQLVRRELESAMDGLLSCLDERQQTILRLHFGMEDGTCHSLEQIGKRIGISKERVRQVEKQAIEKLQKLGESLGLEDFLVE